MILIVTNRDDHTADWLILELERRQGAFARFNTEDFPTRSRLAWRSDGTAVLSLDGRPLVLDDVSAIWYRRPRPPAVPDYSPDRRRWAEVEAMEALTGVWRTTHAVWVNHPDSNRRAACKPAALQAAAAAGFTIPPTLVTNDATEATRFVERFGPEIICKPLVSGRVADEAGDRLFFTSLLPDTPDHGLSELGPEPYMFQPRVAKECDVRVTVIGERVFATRIESQTVDESKVDWRRLSADRLRHVPILLPDDLEQRCRAFVASNDLRFGAIDLTLRGEEYTFLEINPNGQWAWIEQLTAQPLRAALADLLLAA